MPTDVPVALARRRSFLDRVARWMKRHPLLAYAAVAAVATVAAWACEYAPPSGPLAAACHLREMLQAKLGGVIGEALRRPLQP